MDVSLRPTTAEDLDFVMALERHEENREFIGQWTREQHVETIARADREHWIISDAAGTALGFVIVYDVRHLGQGIYIKRIAIGPKSVGVGRRALAQLLDRSFQHQRAEFVTLAVFAHNARAQRAYRAVGFDLLAQTPDERATMRCDVDPFSDACVVMISRARLAR